MTPILDDTYILYIIIYGKINNCEQNTLLYIYKMSYFMS